MIGQLDNRPGWKCEACGKQPAYWWTTSCPKGCAHTVMACGRCASQADVERMIEDHVQTCARALPEQLSGAYTPPAPLFDRRALIRKGASYGVQLGQPAGQTHATVGGLLGAALGGLAGHILNLPELQPIFGAIQKVREPLEDVAEIIRASKK